MTDDRARVVVPFVAGMLHPATAAALDSWGGRHERVELPADNDTAYARLLQRLWRAGGTFAIVEQDMVPTPGQLDGLTGCGHAWCGYRYFCGSQLVSMSFGMVRFGAAVVADHPTLADQAAIVAGHLHRPTPWWSLAENMTAKMLSTGHVWQAHPGIVAHAHGRRVYV